MLILIIEFLRMKYNNPNRITIIRTSFEVLFYLFLAERNIFCLVLHYQT